MNWSFIICTDGITNVHLHNSIVKSIIKQSIPNFEIIFATENMKFIPIQHPNIVTVFCNTVKDAHITFKKNLASKFAKYENLCILHDYIILANNWYKSMCDFNDSWNVCSTRILKNDGSRLNDWIVYNHPVCGHSLVDYTTPTSEYHYVPGLAFCVKRQFILEYPLDENLIWGQGEDLEWSNRIKSNWDYKINTGTFLQSMKQK
jgi:hypothetical protein